MQTERCYLRRITLDDKENIYNILKKEEVISNLNMQPITSILDVEKLINNYLEEYNKGNYDTFVIIDKKTNCMIGVFVLKFDIHEEDAYESTVYIDPYYWNKGFVTEIMQYMVNYFFENYKNSNFRGYIMSKNKASRRVLEKVGFKLEKRFHVPYLEEEIISFLMTRDDYIKKIN